MELAIPKHMLSYSFSYSNTFLFQYRCYSQKTLFNLSSVSFIPSFDMEIIACFRSALDSLGVMGNEQK